MIRKFTFIQIRNEYFFQLLACFSSKRLLNIVVLGRTATMHGDHQFLYREYCQQRGRSSCQTGFHQPVDFHVSKRSCRHPKLHTLYLVFKSFISIPIFNYDFLRLFYRKSLLNLITSFVSYKYLLLNRFGSKRLGFYSARLRCRSLIS